MKIANLLPFFCAIVSLHAETPAEAHAELVKSFQGHKGWELEYTLSKDDGPGVMISLNIAEGGKHLAVEFQTMEGSGMMGFGYYPPADGGDPRLFVENTGTYAAIPLGREFMELFKAFKVEKKGKAIVLDSSATLTRESVGLGLRFEVTAEPPYPWGDEILASIDSVERDDGKVIFHGKNDEKITFNAENGLLLEHFLIGETPRLMKLTGHKELPLFQAKEHGLKGKTGLNEDLEKLLKETFSKQHQLVMIAGSLALSKADDETREEALLDYEKALIAHYETLEAEMPALCDPQGIENLLKDPVIKILDNLEKGIVANGQNVKRVFQEIRPRLVERVAKGLAPPFAKKISKKPLFGIDPAKFAVEDRPIMEAILASHRLIMIHHLFERQVNEQLDLRLAEK